MGSSLLLIVEREQQVARVVYSRALAEDYAEDLTSGVNGGQAVEWSPTLIDLYRAGLLALGLPDLGDCLPSAVAWALGDNVFALIAKPPPPLL